MNTPKLQRAASSGRFVVGGVGKLPPVFKVSLADGKSFSVVRRDIMDSALGREAKK